MRQCRVVLKRLMMRDELYTLQLLRLPKRQLALLLMLQLSQDSWLHYNSRGSQIRPKGFLSCATWKQSPRNSMLEDKKPTNRIYANVTSTKSGI